MACTLKHPLDGAEEQNISILCFWDFDPFMIRLQEFKTKTHLSVLYRVFNEK